jgi:hypothetical protein
LSLKISTTTAQPLINHSQPRILVSTAPINLSTQQQLNSNGMNNNSNPNTGTATNISLFITTVTTAATNPTSSSSTAQSNLTIHQIAINPSQITQIVTPNNGNTGQTTSSTPTNTVNIKNINSKLTETLQLNTKSLVIDPKLTNRVTTSGTTASIVSGTAPTSINYIKTTSINPLTTHSNVLTSKSTNTSILLNDTNQKTTQQTNLISIIGPSNTHQIINTPQVQNLLNQIKNQHPNLNIQTTSVPTQATIQQQTQQPVNSNQTNNLLNIQSPSSSPLKPNIIRKTSKPLFDSYVFFLIFRQKILKSLLKSYDTQILL